MFNALFLRKTIRKYVDEGISQYIIYPFGVNGVNVRNCLRDCFDMEAVMIVDNAYANYNKKIADFRSLRKNYAPDMYVMLTIEDKSLNEQLENLLLEFVERDHIINFLSEFSASLDKLPNSIPRWEVGTKLNMDSLLPRKLNKEIIDNWRRNYKSDKQKIKVRFLHETWVMWNTLKSICEAFERDERFDVLIILGVFYSDAGKEQMKKENHNYILYRDYYGELDNPDIVILSTAWTQYPYEFGHNEKLIIGAAQELIRYYYSIEKFWRVAVELGFDFYHTDYLLFDSLLYHELMNSQFRSERIIEMGNAKFDGIYQACRKKSYYAGWEKLEGKKVILWTTDHGIYNGRMTNEITVDLYAKVIFEYIAENEDVGLVFRPHPTLLNELLKNEYWSKEDFDRLKQYCALNENVVFDDTDTFDNAFSVADAIITDAYTDITCSALPLLKPVCLLYRSKECEPYHEELAESYYAAHDIGELISFFEMLKRGEDERLAVRKANSQKCVKHFDGKNGERIKEFIANKYFELFHPDQSEFGML